MEEGMQQATEEAGAKAEASSGGACGLAAPMTSDLLILEAGLRIGMTALLVITFACGMVAGWCAKRFTFK